MGFHAEKEMADRRRIVIPTGESPEDPLSTPHFDAEATLTARPVVPLTGSETYQGPYGNYHGRAAKPFWKHPASLVLVSLVAIGVGIAAGFAIGVYRNRSASEAPVVTTPGTSVEKADQGQTVEPSVQLPPQARATVPEEVEEVPVQPIEEDNERPARNDRKANDDQAEKPIERDRRRESSNGDNDGEDGEDERVERERRREERRERRRQREEEKILPRQIERRADRELDKIREIFEGRQP